MTETQDMLVKIIGKQLFSVQEDLPPIEDYKSLLAEAQQQAVLPIVLSCLEDTWSSDEEKQLFKKRRAEYQASGIRNLYYHKELNSLLSEHNIPYVILKGQASAYYYPEPMLRTMGDVDFLVMPADIDKVDELLVSQGFRKLDGAEKHDYHWAYHKDLESMELHWDVPGVPETDNEVIKAYLSDIIEKRRMIQALGGEFAIPAPVHHGLVLLLHTITHMTATGIGLRHLCDWLVFENSLSDKEFVSSLQKPLQDVGLWKFAQVLSKIGVMYFGCENRDWCNEADEKLCTAFLDDVFAGGNFGTKDGTRRSQAKLIRNNVTKKVENKTMLTNILISINEKAKRDYPVMKKNPVLLPAGWIIVCVQYFFRIILRKRNNVFEKTIYSDAITRQKLYSELKLFETD